MPVLRHKGSPPANSQCPLSMQLISLYTIGRSSMSRVRGVHVKILLTVLLALCLMLPASARRFTLEGQCHSRASMAYLKGTGLHALDSVRVVNGHFRFEGTVDSQLVRTVFTNSPESDELTFVADGEGIRADLLRWTVSGTPENDSLNVYMEMLRPFRRNVRCCQQAMRCHRIKGEAIPDTLKERVSQCHASFSSERNRVTALCCSLHAQRVFPIVLLSAAADYMKKEDAVRWVDDGKPAYMKVPYARRLRRIAAGWKLQLTGESFPDIEIADTEGQTHALSEYLGKGKYVLLDFWSSRCVPCRREIPYIKAAYEKYRDRGFDVVGISLDTDKKAWTGAIQRLNLPWHHLSDLKGWKGQAAMTYSIQPIPFTLLYGPDGKVIARELRGENLDNTLKELFR